jgi:hypothetical protein
LAELVFLAERSEALVHPANLGSFEVEREFCQGVKDHACVLVWHCGYAL